MTVYRCKEYVNTWDHILKESMTYDMLHFVSLILNVYERVSAIIYSVSISTSIYRQLHKFLYSDTILVIVPLYTTTVYLK